MMISVKEIINKLAGGENLSEKESAGAMTEIMEGRATEAQIAAFLMGLRLKGETVDEITGCARVMRAKVLRLPVKDTRSAGRNPNLIADTCGTGGDNAHTFNISTAAALVAAAGGLPVAKHGNRAVSSTCGSADVLRELGVNLDLPPERVAACLEEVGICFLYAPHYHSAMKHAQPVRAQLGIRTIFNILGPLTNPADAKIQILGVYDPELTRKMAEVLRNLGTAGALVVYGEDSFDEVSITGRTRVAQLAGGQISEYFIHPSDFGLPTADPADIRGGEASVNARLIRSVLSGEPGPRRRIVLLNTAAAFLAAEKVKTWAEGIALAEEAIDSGKASARLEALVEYTNRADI